MISMRPELGRIEGFVAALLAEEGAIVEAIEPEGLEVLAPPAIQQALGLPELSRLGFGAALPPGAERVGLENDWLERFWRVLDGKGRWARQVLGCKMQAPSNPEEVIARELVLDNATFRLHGTAPAWTRYLIFDFRFTAISEEKREGLLRFGVNLATGALPDAMLRHIELWIDEQNGDSAVPEAALPPFWDRQRLLSLVADALPFRLDAALAPFVKGLLRRLSRDQDRLHGYYDDLHGDAMRRLCAFPEGDPARLREEHRVDAIRREYQAKIDDLTRQYELRVGVEWAQTLELVVPVHRFEVQIRRRKAERVVYLDWNPLARRLELPACEFTRSIERPRMVCDDAMHLVIPAGLARCAACGKPFCRACHRKACPKCGHPVERLSLAARPVL